MRFTTAECRTESTGRELQGKLKKRSTSKGTLIMQASPLACLSKKRSLRHALGAMWSSASLLASRHALDRRNNHIVIRYILSTRCVEQCVSVVLL